MSKPINIIDLFAGPGGLGEGFSSLKNNGKPAFSIRMSVEKEESAHKTLTLRAFYRALSSKMQRNFYHDYVAGRISKEEMITALPQEWAHANEETLGAPAALGLDNESIHKRLRELRRQHAGESWMVIGGPPCQAYSLAGRSRNKGIEGYRAEADHRHFLYQEYLQVLDIIQPDVFVMENVKGILTSAVGGEKIFPKIRRDLEHPAAVIRGKSTKTGRRYKIYSLVVPPSEMGLFGPEYLSDSSYIIKAENFGIPQARHRVILLGLSEEVGGEPGLLQTRSITNIEQVLMGLPALRSKLSKGIDSPDRWASAINDQAELVFAKSNQHTDLRKVAEHMLDAVRSLKVNAPTSATKYTGISKSKVYDDLVDWLLNDQPEVLLNHESRGHIQGDLGRYLFCSSWAELNRGKENNIPKAKDFPRVLWPKHANWESGAFTDRFRVQARGRPATTITSHISKDGHYFIHFDPKQCRSLTVREAARIQTFPDNYFFEGNRTQQYVQVGNAVPPFLATQIAKLIHKVAG